MATVEPEGWSSRIGLVLAVAGSAVGLGNFLRFPAEAAQNGGGAFLVPYLVSFLVMGIPLLWVEWAIGRHAGGFGLHSTPGVLDVLGPQRWLKYLGVFGLFIQLAVAAFYCYIESWALAYTWHSAIGTFRGTPATEFFPHYLGTAGATTVAAPREALVFFAITLGLNVWILSRGVSRGIETAAKIGLPLLLLFGVVLAVRGLTLGAGEPGVVASPLVGLDFVWRPDLSGLGNPTTWLAAAGQVFFTLSVGVGSIACYASYVGRDDDIALNAAAAGWMNELVEVVLGSAIMIPIGVAYLGLDAVQEATRGGDGFALGFLTLPTLFANWGWFAPLAGVLWFGLLFLAGITSSLSLGQPLLAFLEDQFRLAPHGVGTHLRRRHRRPRPGLRLLLPRRRLRRVQLLGRHRMPGGVRHGGGVRLRLDLRHRARLGGDHPRRRHPRAARLPLPHPLGDAAVHPARLPRRPGQAGGGRLGRRLRRARRRRRLAAGRRQRDRQGAPRRRRRRLVRPGDRRRHAAPGAGRDAAAALRGLRRPAAPRLALVAARAGGAGCGGMRGRTRSRWSNGRWSTTPWRRGCTVSGSAWLMLGITWSVVIGVSGYLFWKVVFAKPRSPGRPVTPARSGGDGARRGDG